MPMPELDPSRFVAAVLPDPSYRLPLPERGRHFLAEGEVVDSADPFYAHLLADGSLKLKPTEAEDGDTSTERSDTGADKPVDPPAKPAAPAPTLKPSAPVLATGKSDSAS